MPDLTELSDPPDSSPTLAPEGTPAPKRDDSCHKTTCNLCGADVEAEDNSEPETSDPQRANNMRLAPGPYVCRKCRPHATHIVELLSHYPGSNPDPQTPPKKEISHFRRFVGSVIAKRP
jgi:hypothetical protein